MARTISTTISTGVTLAPGDDPVTITPSGYVSGPIGISGPLGTSWTIINQHTVVGTSSYGISLAQGGTITNVSGALISGTAGIFITTPDPSNASAGSVNNAGTILATGPSSLAIYLQTVGNVTNAATGTIQGGWGIKISGQDATIDNQGLISATETLSGGYGIYLRSGGTVINGQDGPSTATIQGLAGVKIDSIGGSFLGTVQNYGTITSSGNYAGASLFQGGQVTNGGSGATAALIQGGRWGVYSGLGATITNFGTILANGTEGIENGVYVENSTAHVNNVGSAALISGYIGVSVSYGTVTNSGTIQGTGGTAVNFISGSNLMVVDPGAVFLGTVAGSLFNSNAVRLGAGAPDTISNFGISFTNFGTMLVDAGATWTLAGATSIKDIDAVGAVSIGAGAKLDITGALSSADAFTLSGGTLHFAGTVSAGSSFDMSGKGQDSLQLDTVTGTTFANAITGFGNHDTITVSNVTFAAGSSVTNDSGTLSIPLQGGGTFTFSNFATEGTPGFVVGAHTLEDVENVACFASGTRIRTDRGDVPVEALRVGDMVVLADGRSEPVIWLGRRTVDCVRHPDPDTVRPVRIKADALGAGVPVRDLVLSPEHALYLQGVMIPVRCLINGSSIDWSPADHVTYHHVELPRHEVLLAEGAATESYLDTGNRSSFMDGRVTALFPNFGVLIWEVSGCAPLVVAGTAVTAARAEIDARAASISLAVAG